MSRLIDADAFSIEMKKRQDKCSEWVKEAKGNYRYRALGAWSMLSEVKLTLDKMPTIVRQEVKKISYADCADAMLMMWMDKVLTDGEYDRIMDKLNAHEMEQNDEC